MRLRQRLSESLRPESEAESEAVSEVQVWDPAMFGSGLRINNKILEVKASCGALGPRTLLILLQESDNRGVRTTLVTTTLVLPRYYTPGTPPATAGATSAARHTHRG